MVYWILFAVKIVLSGALAVLSYMFWQWAKSGAVKMPLLTRVLSLLMILVAAVMMYETLADLYQHFGFNVRF